MEAKIRIIEISPKLKLFKNNSKDIISISFISDNYSVKIEDVEKAILSNEQIIISLKEIKDHINKNIIQPIKYSFIRNNNNILGKGEFIPTEGIKWYKFIEKNNNVTKETYITPSTSNGNIKKNNLIVSRRAHNLSDSHNSYAKEPFSSTVSKNNLNKLNNSNSLLSIMKIKLAINIINKKIISNKKLTNTNNRYNSIKNSNYIKEGSDNSSKYDGSLLDKNRDIFNEEDFTIEESDLSKFNQKTKVPTTSKKIYNQKTFYSGINTKRFSKKQFNFNSNQKSLAPGNNMIRDNETNTKIISDKINNNKAMSPKKRLKNLASKKLFNEDIKMKTSIGFNKRKNIDNKDILNEDDYKNEISRKINSCENIEDEILDQNFKNYLKNDEILKANLSRNNSFNNLTQNNNNGSNGASNYHNTYSTQNNEFLPQTTRIKNIDEQDNNNQNGLNKKMISQELNANSLYADLQLLKTNSDYECVITESISKNLITNNENNSFEDNIFFMNGNENFEKLKTDFFLLYSDEKLNKINNDVLFLEIQLMIEKILNMQDKHQKEYMELFKSININKKFFDNYQNKYILLVKQVNKLNTKKLFNDIRDKRKELYNENINNFINTRSKIMDKGEFLMWEEIMEKANKSKIINNNKKKIINIFLNICEKNEIHLNKLSLKFYKEIKSKQIKKNTNNIMKRTNKFNSSSHFTEKKATNKNMRVKETETDSNIPHLRTNNNVHQNNNRLNFNRYKKMPKKNPTKINLNKEDTNNKNNNINFGTMINENISHDNYYNSKKINNYKNKSTSIGDKVFRKKRGVNKSQ